MSLRSALTVVSAACLSTGCGPTSRSGPARVPSAREEPLTCDVRFRSWRSGPRGSPPELIFTPDGSRIVVDGRWSFDPSTRVFKPFITCPEEGSLCQPAEIAFAPHGLRFVLVRDGRFALGELERELAPFQAIPRWLAPDAASNDVSNVAVWLSADTLLFQQSYADGHGEAVCRLLTLASKTFSTVTACPQPAASQLGALELGTQGLLAMQSSTEGTLAQEIVRYSLERGQEKVVASVTLSGLGVMSAWVAPDGARVGFLSPCELRGEPPPTCEAVEDVPMKLYEHDGRTDKLRLLREDLPPDAIFDPQHERFAWPWQRALCVGNPGSAERCSPLPPAETTCR